MTVAILHRVSKIVSSGLDLDEMLRELIDLTVRVTACDACLVYLVDHATEEIVLRASQLPHDREIGQVRLQMGEGVTGWVALNKSVVALPENAAADSRFKAFQALPEDTYEAFLSAPLIDSGDVIGVINVHHRDKHVHSTDERGLLAFLGEQMGGAITASRLATQTESTVRRIETLAAIAQAITTESYLDRILRAISEMVAASLDSPACSIVLSDEQRREPPHRPGLRSPLSVPLLVRDSVLGVINIYMPGQRTFTSDEMDFVKVVAGQAAAAIDNARLLAATIDLKRTLETRNILERAKAILQSKFHLTEEQAYLRLRDESRRRRRPMRDLAEAVIMSDEMINSKE